MALGPHWSERFGAVVRDSTPRERGSGSALQEGFHLTVPQNYKLLINDFWLFIWLPSNKFFDAQSLGLKKRFSIFGST